MFWDERYRIGDGERTTDETAPAVYRSYPECGITMTEELFNQITLRYKIYFATTDLKDIIFTPKTVLPQGMSDYYFTHLQVKFPRNK